MKKYHIPLDKACLIVAESIRDGVPQEYLNSILEAVSRGYFMGHIDNGFGFPMNEMDYGMDEIKMLIKALGSAREG